MFQWITQCKQRENAAFYVIFLLICPFDCSRPVVMQHEEEKKESERILSQIQSYSSHFVTDENLRELVNGMSTSWKSAVPEIRNGENILETVLLPEKVIKEGPAEDVTESDQGYCEERRQQEEDDGEGDEEGDEEVEQGPDDLEEDGDDYEHLEDDPCLIDWEIVRTEDCTEDVLMDERESEDIDDSDWSDVDSDWEFIDAGEVDEE